MDVNHRLIEAVRQCPLLYKNNASLSDRRCGWQQIAQQMKMQEALLKTRWHFLREHYKRNAIAENQLDTNQFPYKKEMEFLLPYLRPPPREDEQGEAEFMPDGMIKPEFVITEKDLENDSGNEEYVFLEVEALGPEYETANVVTRRISENELKKELQQEHEQQQEEYETEELTHIEMEVHVKEEDVENKETYNVQQADKETSKEATEATCNRNGTKEDEAVRSQIQEASEEKREAKVDVREDDSSSDNRCEDAIFGELVSAMLKKMPAEKKRNVKRDIMNLLLT
ncbi:uncharacterized protein LOC105214606 [Zeugodacus cucurbitae]|uniref:uncharacterized protein LOC105214606 n=1 Tax=Zeugodacus cucurbitae TaxID=28588 RepID=UPI0023D90F7E|nr:uncharacterized protein LOC105214606 [Zeugodacus cucurbitae]